MTRDEAKEIILRQKPDFLQRAKVAGYICPQCGNGSGENGTGITLHKTDGRHYKCFKCGLYEDIVGLWKLYSGVSDNNAAFEGLYSYYRIDIDNHITGADSKRINEGYKRMKEQKEEQKTGGAFGFEDVVNEPADGIELEDGTRAAWPKEEPEANDQKGSGSGNEEPAKGKELQDYTAFFLKANKDLPNTNYYRGISFETLNRYKVGYVEKWKVSEKAPYSPRLIIPTSKYSYLARDTREGLTGKAKEFSKPHIGPIHTFNAKRITTAERPIFIVEGEIDALSVIDVGGEAVGLGGINAVDKFLNLLKEHRAEIKQPFIIALDNEDKKEVKAAVEKLKTGLQQLSIPYIEYNPCGAEKDANDALQKDRAAFTAAIEAAYKIDIPEVPKVKTEEETLQKIRDLMDALRGCDTFSERKQIEREILRVASGDDREPTETEKEEYLQNTAAAHMREFMQGIADSVNTKCIPTGFPILDRILDGGLYEGLYIIGALSSLGKTTLMLQMMDNIAKGDPSNGIEPTDVLIFSLEMSRAELMAKSISRETLEEAERSGIDTRNAKTTRGITSGARYKDYSKTENDLIDKAIKLYNEYAEHVYILEGIGDIGAQQVREAVNKHITYTGRRPVVLIDYIQILAPVDMRATDKQNMDKAVLELKKISRDYKIPVLGISSLNRQSYEDPVTMQAFKETGSIEYSSDVLMGLQFKGIGTEEFDIDEARAKNPREILLPILKNRNGATGKIVEFEYMPMFNRYEEIREAEPVKKKKKQSKRG